VCTIDVANEDPFFEGWDADLESGVITAPKPPCKSPSSSNNEDVLADLRDMGDVGERHSTEGFVYPDTGAGEAVGEDQAFINDCDISDRRSEARFWFLANVFVRWSSSHFFPIVPITQEGVPGGKPPRPGINNTGAIVTFARLSSGLDAGLPSLNGVASRDLRLRIFAALSSTLEILTTFVKSIVRSGLTVRVDSTSSTIRTRPFSSSSGDSNGKSSSAVDELMDD